MRVDVVDASTRLTGRPGPTEVVDITVRRVARHRPGSGYPTSTNVVSVNSLHIRLPASLGRGGATSGGSNLMTPGAIYPACCRTFGTPRVGLELPILALIHGLANVAWRPASDLR
jgi:hypothetical protein